jgi:hypothetical protein
MEELAAVLEARKRDLKQAREKYIVTAQHQIGGFDGAISEIERLLKRLAQQAASTKKEKTDDAS